MAKQVHSVEHEEGQFECACGMVLRVPFDEDGVQLLREAMFAHRPCSDLVQEIVYEEVPDDTSGLEDSF